MNELKLTIKKKIFYKAFPVLLLLAPSNCIANACAPSKEVDINHDQIVNWKDYWLVARSMGTRPPDPRYNPAVDLNCDKKLDADDLAMISTAFNKTFPAVTQGWLYIEYATSQASNFPPIKKPSKQKKVLAGESFNLSASFRIQAKNNKPFSIVLEHKLSPKNGLTLLTGSQQQFSSNKRHEIKKQLTLKFIAIQAGQYTLSSQAAVRNSEARYQDRLSIIVLDKEAPNLRIQFITGYKIPYSKADNTGVLVRIQGPDVKQISKIEMLRLDKSQVKLPSFQQTPRNRNVFPENQTLLAGAQFDLTDLEHGHCASLSVRITLNDRTYTLSYPQPSCISKLPVGFKRADKSELWKDNTTGKMFAKHIVVLQLKKAEDEKKIQSISYSIDAEIVGQSRLFPYVQLRIKDAVITKARLAAIKKKLSVFEDVIQVDLYQYYPFVTAPLNPLCSDPRQQYCIMPEEYHYDLDDYFMNQLMQQDHLLTHDTESQ